jgi:hypothetical protein
MVVEKVQEVEIQSSREQTPVVSGSARGMNRDQRRHP